MLNFLETAVKQPCRRRLTSETSISSRQMDPLQKVLDMKEYIDKQQKDKEKGQKMIQEESVETGRVCIKYFCLMTVLF